MEPASTRRTFLTASVLGVLIASVNGWLYLLRHACGSGLGPAPQGPMLLRGVLSHQTLYSATGFRLAPGAIVTHCTLRGRPSPEGILIEATEWWQTPGGVFRDSTVLAEGDGAAIGFRAAIPLPS